VSKKHQITYAQIFSKPDHTSILWDDFILMLEYLGADLKTKSGSAMGIKLNGVYAVFHRPHPQKTLYPSDLKRIRRFLLNANIKEVK
jgi:hypothetical protein